MSRSNNISYSFEDKIIFEMQKFDFYLQRLSKYLNEKINELDKERPEIIDSENKWHYDSFIDSEIYEHGVAMNLLLNNSLTAYYSFLEVTLKEICNYLKSELNLGLKVNDIHGEYDLLKYRKYIEKVVYVRFNQELNKEWQTINEYRKIRNLIVHHLSNFFENQESKSLQELSKKEQDYYDILKRNNHSINVDLETGYFSLNIRYVLQFSKLIHSFLFNLIKVISNKKNITKWNL